MNENEPSAAALEAAQRLVTLDIVGSDDIDEGNWDWSFRIAGMTIEHDGLNEAQEDYDKSLYAIARTLDAFAAARVAEAVAAERARIHAVLDRQERRWNESDDQRALGALAYFRLAVGEGQT